MTDLQTASYLLINGFHWYLYGRLLTLFLGQRRVGCPAEAAGYLCAYVLNSLCFLLVGVPLLNLASSCSPAAALPALPCSALAKAVVCAGHLRRQLSAGYIGLSANACPYLPAWKPGIRPAPVFYGPGVGKALSLFRKRASAGRPLLLVRRTSDSLYLHCHGHTFVLLCPLPCLAVPACGWDAHSSQPPGIPSLPAGGTQLLRAVPRPYTGAAESGLCQRGSPLPMRGTGAPHPAARYAQPLGRPTSVGRPAGHRSTAGLPGTVFEMFRALGPLGQQRQSRTGQPD